MFRADPADQRGDQPAEEADANKPQLRQRATQCVSRGHRGLLEATDVVDVVQQPEVGAAHAQTEQQQLGSVHHQAVERGLFGLVLERGVAVGQSALHTAGDDHVPLARVVEEDGGDDGRDHGGHACQPLAVAATFEGRHSHQASDAQHGDPARR